MDVFASTVRQVVLKPGRGVAIPVALVIAFQPVACRGRERCCKLRELPEAFPAARGGLHYAVLQGGIGA